MVNPSPKQSGQKLLRQELPWLVAEVVLLLVLLNANAPELWFWLVVLLVEVVCADSAVPIYLVGLSGLGCRRTHPARLTSFFCSWS